MNFLKTLTRSMYESIVEDEFLQPISEQEVYTVINFHKDKPSISTKTQKQQEIKQNIKESLVFEKLALMTVEIEFRMLGNDPNVEGIAERVSELKRKLQYVQGYMLNHYWEYVNILEKWVAEYEAGREVYSCRMKALALRRTLLSLNNVFIRSKAIVRQNIKIKNLKAVLKIIEKIPNVKKMNLVQLKSFEVDRLFSQEETPLKLNCLSHLQEYIDQASNKLFRQVITQLSSCLIVFEGDLYGQAVKGFLISSPKISFQKLMMSLIEREIRDKDEEQVNCLHDLWKIVKRYTSVMINVHKIVRWHRLNWVDKGENEKNQGGTEGRKWSIGSETDYLVSNLDKQDCIYINGSSLKTHFCELIDQCLSNIFSDRILTREEEYRHLFEYTYLIGRLGQLGFSYAGADFSKTVVVIKEYITNKLSIMFTRNMRDIGQSLGLQKADWNRLPYHNNFRCQNIDRMITKFRKYQQTDLWKNMSDTVVSFLDKEYLENQQVEWEIDLLRLPDFQKVKEVETIDWAESQVIVCQSSIKLLQSFEQYALMAFYIPCKDLKTNILRRVLFLCEYYLYHLFNIFLSAAYRQMFFEVDKQQIDRAYSRKRISKLYPQLFDFVISFKKGIEKRQDKDEKLFESSRREMKQVSGNDQNQLLKAKIVSTESFQFALSYLQVIVKTVGNQDWLKNVERLKDSNRELSVLLLTQSSQKMLGNQIEIMKNFISSNINWSDNFNHIKEYSSKIMRMMRQTYERIRSINKGEIPNYVLQKIFALVWRTLLTLAVRTFLEKSHSSTQKLTFQLFLDHLYETTETKQGITPAYVTFKSIFPILLSQQWTECKDFVIRSLTNFEFIYNISMLMVERSECMTGLSQGEKDERRNELRLIIEDTILA